MARIPLTKEDLEDSLSEIISLYYEIKNAKKHVEILEERLNYLMAHTQSEISEN